MDLLPDQPVGGGFRRARPAQHRGRARASSSWRRTASSTARTQPQRPDRRSLRLRRRHRRRHLRQRLRPSPGDQQLPDHQQPGFYSGGIRAGFTRPDRRGAGGLEYVDSQNDYLYIHHNDISNNGGLGGAGGGITLYTGSDNYLVTANFICGNFSMGDGGGSATRAGATTAPSPGQLIFQFNQSFNQGTPVTGGGGSSSAAALPSVGGLSRRLRQRDHQPATSSRATWPAPATAAAIRMARANGADVAASPNSSDPLVLREHLQQLHREQRLRHGRRRHLPAGRVQVRIIHNTITHNDSTGTAGGPSPNGPNESNPQPAGSSAGSTAPTLRPSSAAATRGAVPGLLQPRLWPTTSSGRTAASTSP